jgi:hypothetical protein
MLKLVGVAAHIEQRFSFQAACYAALHYNLSQIPCPQSPFTFARFKKTVILYLSSDLCKAPPGCVWQHHQFKRTSQIVRGLIDIIGWLQTLICVQFVLQDLRVLLEVLILASQLRQNIFDMIGVNDTLHGVCVCIA